MQPANGHLRLHIELDGRVFDEDLATVAFIQPDLQGLNEGLAANPKLFAWWGTMAEIARDKKAKLEDELRYHERAFKETMNRIEGELTARYFKDPNHKGAKVDEVKGLVATDPQRTQTYDDYETRRSSLRCRLTDAEHMYNQIKVGLDTIGERGESLKEISRNMREEMEQKLHVAGKILREFPWGKNPNTQKLKGE